MPVHRLLQRLRTKEPEAVRQAQLEGLERDARETLTNPGAAHGRTRGAEGAAAAVSLLLTTLGSRTDLAPFDDSLDQLHKLRAMAGDLAAAEPAEAEGEAGETEAGLVTGEPELEGAAGEEARPQARRRGKRKRHGSASHSPSGEPAPTVERGKRSSRAAAGMLLRLFDRDGDGEISRAELLDQSRERTEEGEERAAAKQGKGKRESGADQGADEV